MVVSTMLGWMQSRLNVHDCRVSSKVVMAVVVVSRGGNPATEGTGEGGKEGEEEKKSSSDGSLAAIELMRWCGGAAVVCGGFACRRKFKVSSGPSMVWG